VARCHHYQGIHALAAEAEAAVTVVLVKISGKKKN